MSYWTRLWSLINSF